MDAPGQWFDATTGSVNFQSEGRRWTFVDVDGLDPIFVVEKGWKDLGDTNVEMDG